MSFSVGQHAIVKALNNDDRTINAPDLYDDLRKGQVFAILEERVFDDTVDVTVEYKIVTSAGEVLWMLPSYLEVVSV